MLKKKKCVCAYNTRVFVHLQMRTVSLAQTRQTDYREESRVVDDWCWGESLLQVINFEPCDSITYYNFWETIFKNMCSSLCVPPQFQSPVRAEPGPITFCLQQNLAQLCAPVSLGRFLAKSPILVRRWHFLKAIRRHTGTSSCENISAGETKPLCSSEGRDGPLRRECGRGCTCAPCARFRDQFSSRKGI